MEDMNTKQKGDIAEQAAILQALKRGWGVLHPVGDRLPYDLVFDLGRRPSERSERGERRGAGRRNLTARRDPRIITIVVAM